MASWPSQWTSASRSTKGCTTSGTSPTSSTSSAGAAPSCCRLAPIKPAATRPPFETKCATGVPSGGWPSCCAA
eukprot:4001702-Pleurochrysis_carterae.AAC.1